MSGEPRAVRSEEEQAVVNVANRFAWAAGVDTRNSRIYVTPRTADEGHRIWRVTYGSGDLAMRGGSFIVELNAEDETVYRILYGQ